MSASNVNQSKGFDMHYNTVNRLLKELSLADHAVRQVMDCASENEEEEVYRGTLVILKEIETCRDAVRKINYTVRR